MTEVKNDYVKFWINDGILYNEFYKPIDLNEKVVKELIKLRHEISNNENQYWCYSFKGVSTMPKDGRDYAAIHGQDFLYASAAVVDSQITKFIVNVFSMIKKPKVPFKAFVKQDEAVNWLKEFKKGNSNK